MGKIIDMMNKEIGRWTVIDGPKREKGHTQWFCKCTCGNTKWVDGTNLRNGKSLSCGCLSAEMASARRTTNLVGQRFDRLLVLKRLDEKQGTNWLWECQCDCGNICKVNTNKLTQGGTKSCGCLQKEHQNDFGKLNYKDLTGQSFGKLTVLYDSKIRKSNHVYWTCKCECGNILDVSSTHLLSGETQSCGCINSQGELKVKTLLTELGIKYQEQYQFEDCINPLTNAKLRFDFYLPDYNCAIEYDGEQHFNARNQGYFTQDKVNEIQARDEIKNSYCKKHNIKLIRIPYTEYKKITKEKILKEII